MLSPDWMNLPNSEPFMCYFLSNKKKIESCLKTQNKKQSFIWFYDPIQNSIEWISLKEIVNALVTEKNDELLDPQRIICGCGIVIDHHWSPKPSAQITVKPEVIATLPSASNAERSAALGNSFNFGSGHNLNASRIRKNKKSFLTEYNTIDRISRIFAQHGNENFTNSRNNLKSKFSSKQRKENQHYRRDTRAPQDVIRIRLTDGPLFISKKNSKNSQKKKFKGVQTMPSNRRCKKEILENINLIKKKHSKGRNRLDSSVKRGGRNFSLNSSYKARKNSRGNQKSNSKYVKSKSTRRKRGRNCSSLIQSNRLGSLKASRRDRETNDFQISQALQIKRHNPLFKKISNNH